MAAPPGTKPPKAGAGRPAGVPNKCTTRIRDAFADLVENNLENLTTWLEAVAEENPKDALKIIAVLAEYTTPKLARTEITGLDGGAVKIVASKDDQAL